jgi:DNA transformation protein
MRPERPRREPRGGARARRGAGPSTSAEEAGAALARLRNLGPYSARLLVGAGIGSPDALRALGAAAAFRRVLFARGGRVSTTLLWALEGALRDEHWARLDPATRARLRTEVERPDHPVAP